MASFLIGAIGTRAAPSGMARLTDSVSSVLSYDDFVRDVANHHKAPFFGKKTTTEPGDVISALRSRQIQDNWHASRRGASSVVETNTKVNRDYNPWAKAGAAVAVSPTNSQYAAVITHDFR